MHPINTSEFRPVRGEREVAWAARDGAGRGRPAPTTSTGRDEQVLCDALRNAQ
jgi:hypothetical protein